MDVRCLAREERADLAAFLAAFLAALPPQRWQAPTLCAGWRLRDVVAHVISYDELGARELAAAAVRCRLRLSLVNAVTLARYDSCAPSSCWNCWPGARSPGECMRCSAAGSG